MKILAKYLPQFHVIPENNEWWGENYTEWTAVKNAKTISKHHTQPKVPLNNNYYDLSNIETWKWQENIINEYNIDGLIIYHYWFLGKKILEKPAENLLANKDINIKYSFCWANESWTRTWYGNDKEILLNQEYGNKINWIEHFNYLLDFFKDERYIKIDNKPLISIYRSAKIDSLNEMRETWEKLAIDNGFNGIYIMSANTSFELEQRDELIDAYYNFEPKHTLKYNLPFIYKYSYIFSVIMRRLYNKIFDNKIVEHIIDYKTIVKFSNTKKRKSTKPTFKGIFPGWDNTPRTKHKGYIYKNSSIKYFSKKLKEIINNSENDEILVINAWNEWGEGCYLEPDSINKFEYLKAIKNLNS